MRPWLALLIGCAGADSATEPLGPVLDVTPSAVTFEPTTPGLTTSTDVTITNLGDGSLGIATLELATATDASAGTPGAFSVSVDPDQAGAGLVAVIPPGQTLPVTVHFDAVAAGHHLDGLVITTADGEGGSVDPHRHRAIVPLVGEGVGLPAIPRAPRTVDLGWVDEPAEADVNVRNVGDAPFAVTAVERTDCPASFAFEDLPALPAEVGAGEVLTLSMTFTPPDDAARTCELTVATDAEAAPELRVVLKANGTCPGDAPEVRILDPDPLPLLPGDEPLDLQVFVLDDQPASQLDCQVVSRILQPGAFVDCDPVIDGTRWGIEVPMSLFGTALGTDVVGVEITDGCGTVRSAHLPVRRKIAEPENDADGDGFSIGHPYAPDCDDTDPDIWPFAPEVHNGFDDDCDDLVDDGTEGYDDDDDGMTELEGDCDDGDALVYTGAPEVQDDVDNDCDGIADENTSAYDDDGDGFSEARGDCDDTDPSLHPARGEVCANGVDDDCDGIEDEPCVAGGPDPWIAGGISTSATVVGPGEQVLASLYAVDADESPSLGWSAAEGSLNLTEGPVVTWTAPDAPGEHTLICSVQDSDDNQVVASATIMVTEGDGEPRGCATGGAVWLVWLGIPLFFRRKP